jgi:hypothetical protein
MLSNFRWKEPKSPQQEAIYQKRGFDQVTHKASPSFNHALTTKEISVRALQPAFPWQITLQAMKRLSFLLFLTIVVLLGCTSVVGNGSLRALKKGKKNKDGDN